MANSEVGSAYIAVRAKTEGFKRDVEAAVESADTASAGQVAGDRAASGFAGGLAKSGAVMGAVSALATKAFDTVSDSLGSAVKRVDTIANFPKVMKNMAIGTDAAEASISKLSDELTGLPTTLDSAASSVQRFTSKNGDIARSTDMFLAVNDAVLAGGAPLAQQSEALEQLSQSYAKGQMDMMEWKTLQMAMPAQLNQVAIAMGMTTEQLGAGLRQAEKDASFLREISMDEFIDQIMRLDREGVAGFASFEEQARSSTAGIETAMANMETAIVRGEAKIIDTIGQENISGAINEISTGIGGLAGDIANGVKGSVEAVKPLVPGLKAIVSTLATVAPAAIQAWAAFKVFQGGRSILSALAGGVQSFGVKTLLLGKQMEQAGTRGASAFQKAGKALAGLSGIEAGGVGIMLAGVAYAAVNLASCYQQAQERQELFTQGTKGMEESVAGIVGVFDSVSGKTADYSSTIQAAKLDLDDYLQGMADHAQAISTIQTSLESQVTSLNTAQSYISQYAGAADLGIEELGRLKWALDYVNGAYGTQYRVVDEATGAISNASGEYDEAAGAAGEYKDSILELIEAKKQEARVSAISQSLTEAYKAQNDAVGAYTSAASNYYEQLGRQQEAFAAGQYDVASGMQADVDHAKQAMDTALAGIDSTNAAVAQLEGQMGDATSAAAGLSSAFDVFARNSGLSAMLQTAGTDMGQFKSMVEESGISVQTLSSLSSRELQTLATSYDGTSESIIQSIQGINAQRLESKQGTVTLDDGQLTDAQGHLYTWNGSELKRMDGETVVDDVELKNAQGEVYTWNNSSLIKQSTSVYVDTSSIDSAVAKWNRAEFGTKYATVIGQSIGSIFPMASGGFVQLHGDGGFIADRPTFIGRDSRGVAHVAGEAGAEWIREHADGTKSVLPMQNRKYMWPYARVIASMIGGGGTVNNNTYVNVSGEGRGYALLARLIAREIRLANARG